MNCNEVHELFGTAIDGALQKGEEGNFRQHIAACPPCRTAFELESLAKRIVRQKIKRVPAPPHLYEHVLRTVRGAEDSAPGVPGWLDRLFSVRVVVPVLATGAAAVALVVLLSPGGGLDPATRHTAANDIINQSIINFALVRSGELKPTMVSCYPEGVVGFLERNGARFAVNVKPMENCDWYGAMSSDYDGVKLAHIVYKLGDDLVYVYQVSENEVKEGSLLRMPSAASKAIAATDWYTDPDHPDCNVVLWRTNGALCAAVSTMKKDRLLALLTTN